MRISYELSTGRKSIDRQIIKTVKYVNTVISNNVAGQSEDELAKWGKTVIEGAIKNIAHSCIAYVE